MPVNSRQFGWLYAAGPVAAFVVTVAMVPRISNDGGLMVFVILAAAIGFAACLFMPRHYLLGVALVVFALVPRRLFADTLLEVFSPAVLVILVWLVRGVIARLTLAPADRPVVPRYPAVLQVIVLLLMVWLAFSTVISSSPTSSIQWTIGFALGAILVLLSPDLPRSIAFMHGTFAVAGSLLALYAVGEFVLEANPIYDTLYAALGQDQVQHWASYRSSVSFGHPLYAGLFFAMMFGLTLGKRLQGGTVWYLVAAFLAAAGTAVTGSRSALVALAAVLAVTVVPALLTRGRLSIFTRVASVIIILGAGVAVLTLPQIQARFSSDEASDSNATRGTLIDLTLRVAGIYHWIGSGTNTSAEAVRPYNVNYALVESGYLQLLVSVGIPGLLLFTALLGITIIVALRRGLLGAAGMMTAYAVAMAFFNILESSIPSLVLIGFCLVSTWGERKSPPPAPVDDPAPATTAELPAEDVSQVRTSALVGSHSTR